VVGIADACVEDPDDRLRELLSLAIDDCAARVDLPIGTAHRELQPTP
jgi:hypothetical protein